jgi:hypothetical protein
VRISGNQMFYGKCLPNSVDFTATVSDPATETAVLLFIRLVDTKTGEYTDWGAGAIMNTDGHGTFTYTLTFKNISHYNEFASAWVQYQLVATNSNLQHLGKTQPFLHDIAMSPCQ